MTDWPAPPPNCRIFASAFGDELLRLARAGDVEELQGLVRRADPVMPHAAWLTYRAEALRHLADQLRAALPGAATWRIARLLVQAGAHLAKQPHLPDRFAGELQADERQTLEATVGRLVRLAQDRRDARWRWPKVRQMAELIGP